MRECRRTHTITYSFTDAVARTVFFSIVSLLCFYSALWMAQDVFPDWKLPGAAKLCLDVLVVFTVAFYEICVKALPYRKWQWLCSLLLPLVYGITVCRYVKRIRIDFEDGACAFGVQFVKKYNKHLHTSYSMWRGKQEFLGMSLSICLISIAMALLVLALLSGFRIFLLLFPGAVLAAELLIGYTPQWQGIAAFFAGAVFLFAGEWDSRRIVLRIHRSGRQQKGVRQLLRQQVYIALMFSVALVAGRIAFRRPAEQLMEKSPQVRQFQKKTEQKITSLSNALFMGRHENVNNHTPHYTGEEVMKITASKQPMADLYLRGFCGTDYENGSWVCRKQAFTDACRQAGYEPQEAGRQLLQASHDVVSDAMSSYTFMTLDTYGMDGFDDVNGIDYEIAYTGLYNKYAYLPYFTDYEASTDKVRILGDVSLEKDRGQEKTTVHGWNYGMDYTVLYLVGYDDRARDDLFQWYHGYVQREYLRTSARVPSAQELLSAINIEPDRILIGSQDYTTQEFSTLLVGVRDLMDSQSVVDRNCMRLLMATVVGKLLRENLSYSLNLDPLPDGADAIEYFLSESHEGYCVHFASAATLMMREIGIPARYVSGYVVRTEKFREQDGSYVASVRDRNAHAWTEIYLEDIGWVPIDVTPGDPESAALNSGDGQQTDSSGQGQQATQTVETQTDTDSDTDTQTDAQEEQDTDLDDRHPQGGMAGGGIGKAGFWIRAAVTLAGLLLAALFLIWAVRKAAREYQKVLRQELKSGQYRKAVIRMNHRLYRRLLIHGKLHGKLRGHDATDAEYGQALEAAYADVPKADWKRYMGIVREAVFSGGELQEEDAYFCYQVCRKMRNSKGNSK